MKTFRKVFLTIIAALLVFNSMILVNAEPFARTYERKSYVAISGKADANYAGYTADLMLIKSTADENALTKDDIGYVGQTLIQADGSYNFEFNFTGFTYTENVVNNYKIILNANGENIAASITKSEVLSDFVTFSVDVSEFGRAAAEINNTYKLKNIDYTMFLVFYGENKMLDIKMVKKVTGDEPVITYTETDIPDGTIYAKFLIWEDLENIFPLVDSDPITFSL